MPWSLSADLDYTDDIVEARLLAFLSVQQCIQLCDISERTWYRWIDQGAPRWAIRLVLSQRPTLDRFGWKNWEIRNGVLYFNELSYRYHWSPAQLVAPLWGIREPHLALPGTDNLSSLESARIARNNEKDRENPPESPAPDLSTYAHNIYYVKY